MKSAPCPLLPLFLVCGHVLQAASPAADAGADIGIADFDGNESVTVVLDAGATTDADGDIVSYDWTWAGGSAGGEVAEGTFPATDSPVTVTLTVTDAASNVAVDTLEVTAYKKETALFTDFPSTTVGGSVEGETFAIGNTAYRLVSGSWVPQSLPTQNFSVVVDPDTILSYSSFSASFFEVFRYDGSSWVESAITLDTPPPSGDPFDRFRYAFSADTAVIANEYNTDNGNEFSGRIFVYDWVGDDFLFAQELINPNYPGGYYQNAFAGSYVDVEDDLIVVTRSPETGSGPVYDLFRKVSGNWTYETTLELPSPSRFQWRDADIENGVILSQAYYSVTFSNVMVVFEYDAINGWEPTYIPVTEPVASQFFGYKMNDDTDSFVAYDESGNFVLFEKDDPAQDWSGTTVSQRRLLVGDLNNNGNVDAWDFSNGYVVVYDSIFDVNRLFDTETDIHPINVEPVADAGADISTTSFDGAPVRAFLNGGGTADLNYGEVLNAVWTWAGGSASGLQTFADLPVDLTTVELTVTDSGGAVSRDSIAVSIDSPPVIDPLDDVIAVDTDGDGSIQLYLEPGTDTPDGEIASWNWRWFGGTLSSKSGVITLGPEANGQSVILEVVDINGLASEIEFTFTLLDPDPTPDILSATDGASLDDFGRHVAIYKGTALVGAPSKKNGGDTIGATYLAENLNNTWQQIPLHPGEKQGTAVAVDDDYAFTGADQYAGGGSFQRNGAVRVYKKDSGLWSLFEIIPNVVTDQYFGASLARDGNYLVVGAPETNIPGEATAREGAAYLYELQGDGTWDLIQTFYPQTLTTQESFGQRVAIKGNVMAVTSESATNTNSGRVYIYEKGPSQWDFVASFEDSAETDEDSYGRYSLAMNETEILVGARSDEEFEASYGRGAVYRYTRDETLGWQANGKILPSIFGSTADSRFGESLALENGILLVGAPSDFSGGAKGSVAIYQLEAGNWNLITVQKMTVAVDPGAGSFPFFSSSVDHDGNDMIVGAESARNDSNVETGKAYIYRNHAALNTDPLKNHEPLAHAGADIVVEDTLVRDGGTNEITEPLGTEQVFLDGSGSSDEENGIVNWEWTWGGNSANGETANVRFPVGTTTVTLTVTDDRGVVNTDTVEVTVTLGQVPPDPLNGESATGLTVDLPDPDARWRLISEFLWRGDGETAPDVVDGEVYEVEVIPYAGALQTSVVQVLASSGVASVELSLPPVSLPPETGTIAFPETAQGFSFRLTGEDTWRDVADDVDGTPGELVAFSLPVGDYRIEFRPVAGFTTPPSREVRIAETVALQLNWDEYLRIDGYDAALTFEEVVAPDLDADPFRYCGMIRTDIGRASGTVVAERTVLSAAHPFFNSGGLAWPRVRWFQRHLQDVRQAPPVEPRGILYRTSYQALVAPDSLPGGAGELPEDDQLVDFAVLYFSAAASTGQGSANFLQSTPAENWLTGGELKQAAAYPQRSQSYPKRGRLFQKTLSSPLTPLNTGELPLLYETGELFGDAGSSGSALFVQPDGSSQLYPAGILLAGQERAVYRIIDADVTRMIKDGRDAAFGNDDIVDSNSSQESNNAAGSLTFLAVDITPTAAATTARWSVTPDSGSGFNNLDPAQQSFYSTNWDSFTITFSEVAGYDTPAPINVLAGAVNLGGVNTYSAAYTQGSAFDSWKTVNSVTTDSEDLDFDGNAAITEYAVDRDPGIPDYLAPIRIVPGAGGGLHAEYEVYVSSSAEGILYTVKAADSLADRASGTNVDTLDTFTSADGPGYQTVTDSKSFIQSPDRVVWVEHTPDP